MNKLLAKVKSADVTISRSCLMISLIVDYEDGMSQGVMGQCLDNYDKARDTRIGTAYGCEMIRKTMATFNVQSFQEITGKHVWVIVDDPGFGQKVLGLQALEVDVKSPKPFIFKEVADLLIHNK